MENSQLLEYIGKTKTQKLQDEITTEYFENFKKKFPVFEENHKMNSLVTVTNDKEILSIGMSCINDLIIDNWANFLGALIAGDSSIQPPPVEIDNTTNNAVLVYDGTTAFNMIGGGNMGSLIQIGRGTNLATRQDFNINSAFANGGSEDNRIGSGSGSWSSGLGKVSIPMQLTTNGSGDISETCMYFQFRAISPVGVPIYLISRDNISPTVGFIGGEQVNVDYSMVFT